MSLPTNINQLGNAEASWMKWDLDKWKKEVQHRTENLPPFLRTPDAIKNATNVSRLFSDANTPVNYYKGDTLPNWEYTNATNCTNFNRGNTTTVNACLNAPKCTNASYAFEKNTALKELTLAIPHDANFEGICDGCSNLEYIFPSVLDISAHSYAFRNCRNIKGEEITVNIYAFRWNREMFYYFGSNNTNFNLLTINIDKDGPFTDGAAAIQFIYGCGAKKIVINNMPVFSWFFATGCPRLEELEIKMYRKTPLNVTMNSSLQSFGSNYKLKRFKLNGNLNQIAPSYRFQNMCMKDYELQFFYSEERIKMILEAGTFDTCRKLSQVTVDLSLTNSPPESLTKFSTGCKFDLVTILNMADQYIGLGTFLEGGSDNNITLGISKYKLAKDTSLAAKEEFPLFFSHPVEDPTGEKDYIEQDYTKDEIKLYNVGKTKFDATDSILYIKNNGDGTFSETSDATQAMLNEYIIIDIEGKTDISTVEDVSAFKDDDWEKYYGYPYTASNVTYYATGPLLKALRTISDRGWNITVQYN